MSLRKIAEVGAVNLAIDGIRVCSKVGPGFPTWRAKRGVISRSRGDKKRDSLKQGHR